jgi:hypothetical protein
VGSEDRTERSWGMLAVSRNWKKQGNRFFPLELPERNAALLIPRS